MISKFNRKLVFFFTLLYSLSNFTPTFAELIPSSRRMNSRRISGYLLKQKGSNKGIWNYKNKKYAFEFFDANKDGRINDNDRLLINNFSVIPMTGEREGKDNNKIQNEIDYAIAGFLKSNKERVFEKGGLEEPLMSEEPKIKKIKFKSLEGKVIGTRGKTEVESTPEIKNEKKSLIDIEDILEEKVMKDFRLKDNKKLYRKLDRKIGKEASIIKDYLKTCPLSMDSLVEGEDKIRFLYTRHKFSLKRRGHTDFYERLFDDSTEYNFLYVEIPNGICMYSLDKREIAGLIPDWEDLFYKKDKYLNEKEKNKLKNEEEREKLNKKRYNDLMNSKFIRVDGLHFKEKKNITSLHLYNTFKKIKKSKIKN